MTTLPLLPPDRTWPAPVEEIAQHIITRLEEDARHIVAALYLLMRVPGQPWARTNVAEAADSGWPWVIDALDEDRITALTVDQRAAIDFVAAFGEGTEIDLPGSMRCLSPASAEAVVDAIRIALGLVEVTR